MLKYLLIILTVTQLSKCNRTIQNENPPVVKVYRATSQQWSGGAHGSGKGTNYQFFLPAADTALTFDSAWVDGYRLALKRFSSVKNKDTLIIQASAFFSDGGRNGDEKKTTPDAASIPSDKIKCTAVLRFRFNKNAPNEYCVTVIQVLPRLNYP